MRALADLRQKTINDKNSEITIAREEGIAIGEERGEVVGRTKEKKEMAKNLLLAGVDVSTIANASGLSIEEINALKME